MIVDFDQFSMLKFDLIDFNRQISEYKKICMTGDKTAVERGLTKREPIEIGLEILMLKSW